MSCDVGKAQEGLENELWRRWSDGIVSEWAELYLRHSSFFNPTVASPTSQLILQPFSCFSYVTDSSLTSFLRAAHVLVMKIQPSTCLQDSGKPRRNLSYVGRHRVSNQRALECESRALPRSHLAPWFRHWFNLCLAISFPLSSRSP